MGDFPLQGDGQYSQVTDLAQQGTISLGGGATAAGSANTKGSWAVQIASTNHAGHGVLLTMAPGAGAMQSFLTDIGIGGAGSEVVLVPNLIYWQGINGTLTNAPSAITYYVPVAIAAGTRVSLRTQSSTAGKSWDGFLQVLGCGMLPSQPLSRVTAYGLSTGTTRGTVLDPGSTGNVNSAWTQLSASTPAPIRQMILAFGWSQTWADGTGQWWCVDIGVGAAGSEVPILQRIQTRRFDGGQNLTGLPSPSVVGPLPVSVPAGTRLSARVSAHVGQATATNREIELAVYGID